MNPRLIFCILVFYCCYPIAAQESVLNKVEDDYRHFREVYNSEFKEPDSSFMLEKISVHPASLEGWLSNIPASNKNTVFTIGISDPGMKEDEAIELAILRAKIVSALLLQSKISSITDNYSNEVPGDRERFVTKYATYYRLQAALVGGVEQFELVNHFFTSFNESVVLLKHNLSVSPETDVDSILLKIDLYNSERQQRNRFELEEKCEVYGVSKQNGNVDEISIFYYFYRSVNQYYEIVSRYNGAELNFPPNIFRYQSLENKHPQLDGADVTYKLTNGMWKAFLQSLLQSYTQTVDCSDIDIGQVSDNYSSLNQNLTREVVMTTPAFRIKGIRVNNNRLSVILKKE